MAARVIGQPYIAVFEWLRKAGVTQTRAEWLRRVSQG
jgi:hypothetical protein